MKTITLLALASALALAAGCAGPEESATPGAGGADECGEASAYYEGGTDKPCPGDDAATQDSTRETVETGGGAPP